MPSGGSVEGSEAGSVDGSTGGGAVSATVEESTIMSGLFDIDTSVQDSINSGNKYFIFSSKVVDSRGVEPLSALVLV
tara:strand:+ start:491 stop:721 length:231 start_codon:yes stop_codon:yes gene_type:complete